MRMPADQELSFPHSTHPLSSQGARASSYKAAPCQHRAEPSILSLQPCAHTSYSGTYTSSPTDIPRESIKHHDSLEHPLHAHSLDSHTGGARTPQRPRKGWRHAQRHHKPQPGPHPRRYTAPPAQPTQLSQRERERSHEGSSSAWLNSVEMACVCRMEVRRGLIAPVGRAR